MKRDWELVRIILSRIEEIETTKSILRPESIEGYEPENISYHMQLLNEAGLIEATCSQPLSGSLHCIARRLTWYGHEFLDQIKSESIWNKTKKILSEKGIDLTFETIKQAVGTVIQSML